MHPWRAKPTFVGSSTAGAQGHITAQPKC